MNAFLDFIDRHGAARLARDLGVTESTVSHWRNGRFRVSPARCRQIEEMSDRTVTVHDLRPDIFGPAPQEAA